MTIKSTSRTAAVLASLLMPAMALSGPAFAQTATTAAPTTPAPTIPAPAAPTQPKAQAAKPASRTDRIEKHIADMHAQLHITPAQQTEWDQFAQVMRENAASMNDTMEKRRTGFATMNAVENMESYAQIAEQHAQNMQKLATTFKVLYGSMSDEQKKNADTVFRARGPVHGHGKKQP
jgi:hypothetical protein